MLGMGRKSRNPSHHSDSNFTLISADSSTSMNFNKNHALLQILLHLYMSYSNTIHLYPPPFPLTRILLGCKQPKTHSIAIVRGNNAATLSDIDRFLFDNFNSLFLHEEDTTMNGSITSRVCEENQGDLRSGSISFDRTSMDILGDLSETSGSRESIVVLVCLASQYEDLQGSMKEMVDRRLRKYGRVDWGFMEELLFCYLNLNERKSYKFILSAYEDLINGLRERSPERAPVTAKPRSVRTFRTGNEIRRKEKTKEVTVQFGE